MALDRVFATPTITVDQDKYDELIKIKTLYFLKLKEEKEHKKMIEMKKLKIMISQPMKGKTEEQIRSERAELVKKLEEKGHEVVDTIFAEETPEGDARLYYLAKSIEAMSKVDAVVFMPGWEKARGCQIEHEIAVKYNKFIKEVEDK
jgi:Asp-tRNA(Asn)/Glu-tRNA(Gln) amidotransferase A subunit family amidase|nr:MAG TPA_asm: deoxyribosyltransferase [Caudoviricetes sp.]